MRTFLFIHQTTPIKEWINDFINVFEDLTIINNKTHTHPMVQYDKKDKLKQDKKIRSTKIQIRPKGFLLFGGGG